MLDRDPGVRRIEAPVLVDRKGTAWTPGLIDVTLRYRERVVLAESPPPGLPERIERALCDSASRLAGARGSAGAFTVTFLADPASGEHRFVSTAPGLPTCVAVIEARDESDLPALEAHLSRGGTLNGDLPEARGHSMQVCLAAFDPEDGFTPSPGVIEALHLPAGAGLRADPLVEEGAVPANGMELSRVTALGRTRSEALFRLQRGLARTEICVRDGATDKAFLAEVLDRPELMIREAPSGWIDELVANGEHLPRRGAEIALLGAALGEYESTLAFGQKRFYESAARGKPQVPEGIGRAFELWYRGQRYTLRVSRLDRRRFRIAMDSESLEVLVPPAGPTGRLLTCGDRCWRVSLAVQGDRRLLEVDGIPHRLEVAAGRSERSSPPAVGGRVRFGSLVPDEEEGTPRRRSLVEARRLLLGYDADSRLVQRLVAGEVGSGSDGDLRLEEEILRTFADVGALFRHDLHDGTEEFGRHSSEEYLFMYLRSLRDPGAGGRLPTSFLDKLRRALSHYGLATLDRSSPELEETLFRIAMSHQRLRLEVPPLLAIFESWLERGERPASPELRDLLERVVAASQGRHPALHDLAREVSYRWFDRPLLLAARERIYAQATADLRRLDGEPEAAEREAIVRALVECPQPLHWFLSERFAASGPRSRAALLEIMVRRYYRIRELQEIAVHTLEGQEFAVAGYEHRGSHVHLIATHAGYDRLAWSLAAACRLAGEAPAGSEIVVDLYLWRPGQGAEEDAAAAEIGEMIAGAPVPAGLQRMAAAIYGPGGQQHFTFRRSEDGRFREERIYRGIHPMLALRMELWRLQNFALERLDAPEGVYFFHGIAHENPRDERLFVVAEVRDFTPVHDDAGRVVQLPELERMLMEALGGIRRFQSRRAAAERLHWNRAQLNVWPPVDLRADELHGIVRRLAPLSEGLGLEKVAVRCRIPDRDSGELRDWVLEISNFEAAGEILRFRKPSGAPLKPLREYAQKVVDMRRRGLHYPYEVIKRLAPSAREAAQAPVDLPPGDFAEHDLDEADRLVPIHRPYGANTANLVVGVVRSFTDRYPEGMTRVILLGDPSRDLGAVGVPECRRILAALDLAANLGAPLEWFALSAGARIALDSGTEDLDWVARVQRRILEFARDGGEINLVVPGINAGPQAFWNAGATMLSTSRGILIMTPEGAMVLGGEPGQDSRGGLWTEDDLGRGGYERVMGPNGQAQYLARDLGEACRILLLHYEHSYVARGERFPRPAASRDPRDRDVREFQHGGELGTVGEVFSPAANPGRRKPFEIRRVMEAACDQDHPVLERWYGMREAEVAVVWHAHLGGHPVCLIGFESKPLPRLGWVPAYGPEQWTAGTLFPLAAKKVARAIEAASGNVPVVVLANLLGFDGSPESMRLGQLEFGVELARAVVSFQGPIVVCVVGRYHGDSLLVFSTSLHDNLEVAALAGSTVSRFDDTPATAVVSREIDRRTRRDARIVEIEKALADPERADKSRLRAQLAEGLETVRAEKRAEVGEELGRVHSLERARAVGSIHHILPPERLRPYLIEAVERGIEKELARVGVGALKLAATPSQPAFTCRENRGVLT